MSVAPPVVHPSVPWERPRPAPPAFVVLPADTPTARRVRSIGGAGVVCAAKFASDAADLEAAAAGVMLGLRKDPLLAYAKRWAAPLAAGWLLANDVHHVVIVDAPDYSLDSRTELAAWLGGLGVQVWFTWTDPANPNPSPSSVCGGAVRVEAEGFWATFPNRATRAVPDPPTGALPRLPRVDGTVFRSACRDQLDPADFEAVDKRFCALVAELRTKVRAHLQPTYKYDLRLLRRLIDHAPDTEELLLRVRAAQVAYLLEGRHVVVNTTALLGAAEALPRRGFSGSPSTSSATSPSPTSSSRHLMRSWSPLSATTSHSSPTSTDPPRGSSPRSRCSASPAEPAPTSGCS